MLRFPTSKNLSRKTDPIHPKLMPVHGVIDYPSTQAIMEALKRGDIDAYPDYNGTGLVMLGQNPVADDLLEIGH